MKFFGQLVYSIFTGMLISLAMAFVFASYWSWFVVPTLQVDPIGIVSAVGLAITVQLIVVLPLLKQRLFADLEKKSKDYEKMDVHWKNTIQVLVVVLFIAPLAYVVGYIWSRWMP